MGALVNQQTVRNWLDRNELPAVRLASPRVRVGQADLDSLIEAGSAGPESDVEDPTNLRSEFADRRDRTQSQINDDAELVASLRALADVATRFARALDRKP